MSQQKGKSGGMNSDRLKLEIRRASIPFLMLVVLGVVGFLNAANIIRNLAGAKFWKSYSEYRVAFDNPEGVVPGRHELRIAGVKSGYIKSAELVNGKGVLTLAVDKDDAKDKPLHTDAKVQIRPVTPLEDMYVDIISRGTDSAPVLKKGQILPVAQTESMTEIGRVLNVLDSDTRPRLSTLLNQLSVGTKDRGASLRQGFAQLGPFLMEAQKATKVLAQRRQHVRGLVHNLGITTKVLGDRDRQLASFIRSGNKTLGELAQNDGPLAATISQLPPTVSNLQTSFAALQNTENRLDAALRAIRPTAQSLPSGLSALRTFSKDAKPAVAALRPSVKAVRPLARSIRPTAADLSQMLPKLSSQTDVLDDLTDKIAQPRCRQYIGNLLSWAPSMLKFLNSDNDGGANGGYKAATDARADVTVDFTSFGKIAFDPDSFIEPQCWLQDTKPIYMKGLAPAFTGDNG